MSSENSGRHGAHALENAGETFPLKIGWFAKVQSSGNVGSSVEELCTGIAQIQFLVGDRCVSFRRGFVMDDRAMRSDRRDRREAQTHVFVLFSISQKKNSQHGLNFEGSRKKNDFRTHCLNFSRRFAPDISVTSSFLLTIMSSSQAKYLTRATASRMWAALMPAASTSFLTAFIN